MSFFERFRRNKPEQIYKKIDANTYRRGDTVVRYTGLIKLEVLEANMRRKAREPLANGKDEAIAQELALLQMQSHSAGAQYDHYEQQLNAIGVKLSAYGDHDRTLQVALRAEYVAGLGQSPWILRLLDMTNDTDYRVQSDGQSPVGDLEREKRMGARARTSLTGEDEEFAQQIALLVASQNSSTGDEFERYEQQLRAIGVKLCSKGGHDRMLQVALRAGYVAGLGKGPWIRLLEHDWDGLCGWME
jgi:hypothetical protein